MPRNHRPILPFLIDLKRNCGITLDKQISDRIRQGILSGELRPGDHLPPIRSLAIFLGVARATLDNAYATLIEEGYICAKPGRGSFVSLELPDVPSFVSEDRLTTPMERRHKQLNECKQYCEKALTSLLPQKNIPLAVVTVSNDMSPGKDYIQIAVKHARTLTQKQVYSQPAGLTSLREAIAYVAAQLRGVHCTPEQVIVTSGSQLGFTMALKLLFNKNDKIWFEDPCYPLLKGAAHLHGVEPVYVPVDKNGLNVAEGLRLAPEARGCFVTPSHQCPLGMLMSMSRRRDLLQWAQTTGSWIIEDDYDSELRYGSHLPFPCLQGMDRTEENVIYVGNFSKMLFPGLRLGYLIVPKNLVSAFSGLRLLLDRQGNELQQATVAEYIHEGLYEIHVRRMRSAFELRRKVLLAACRHELSAWGDVVSGDQGMHVVFQFHDQTINDMAVEKSCIAAGVEARGISFFYERNTPIKGLMLGFGFFTPEQILRAVQKIRQVLEQF